MAKTTQDIPKLFADTKEKLGQISESEWAAIPEVGDHTLQYKEKKEDIYTPVPENILETARLSEAVSGVVSETNSLFDDVHRLSGARGQMLQHKFDHISRSGLEREASASLNVDAKGYLSELSDTSGSVASSFAEIGDVKKARALFRSAQEANPGHAPSWIASARLEESLGKISEARRIMAKDARYAVTPRRMFG